MLALWLEQEQANRTGSRSFWQPYLDALPDVLTYPAFWNESEKALLKDFHVLDTLPSKKDFRRDFRPYIRSLLESLAPVTDSNEQDQDGLLFATYHRLGSIISAYSFTDETCSDPLGRVVLVPLADALNHSSTHNNARLYFDTDALSMVAVADIDPGFPIFNTYGDLDNAQLLTRYGFTEENNPNDTLILPYSILMDGLSRSTCVVTSRFSFLQSHWTDLDQAGIHLSYDVDCLEELLLPALRVLCCSDVEYKRLTRSLSVPARIRKEEIVEEMAKDLLSSYRTWLCGRLDTGVHGDEIREKPLFYVKRLLHGWCHLLEHLSTQLEERFHDEA